MIYCRDLVICRPKGILRCRLKVAGFGWVFTFLTQNSRDPLSQGSEQVKKHWDFHFYNLYRPEEFKSSFYNKIQRLEKSLKKSISFCFCQKVIPLAKLRFSFLILHLVDHNHDPSDFFGDPAGLSVAYSKCLSKQPLCLYISTWKQKNSSHLSVN